MPKEPLTQVRIDRWLYAARFFKTRSLSQEAVNGGKVHLHGQRVKPSRAIQLGDLLVITKGVYQLHVEVVGLTEKRVSAPLAAQLYKESAESIAARTELAEQNKMARSALMIPDKKPDKRDRRKIKAFKGQF